MQIVISFSKTRWVLATIALCLLCLPAVKHLAWDTENPHFPAEPAKTSPFDWLFPQDDQLYEYASLYGAQANGRKAAILLVCCWPILFRITAALWQEFAEAPAFLVWEVIFSFGSLVMVAILAPDDPSNETTLYYGFWVALSVFALNGLATLGLLRGANRR